MNNKSQIEYNKLSEKFNFIHHKTYDVSKIKEIIDNFDEEWHLEESRQYQQKALSKTLTYFLKRYEIGWKVGDSYDTRTNYKDSEIWKIIDPIVKDLEIIHNGKRGSVMICMLTNEDIIPAHFDPGEYLGVVRRNHIPVITNKDVLFSVDSETVNMKEGECWEINNSKLHRVVNKSKMDRVHIIIDIIPDKYLK